MSEGRQIFERIFKKKKKKKERKKWLIHWDNISSWWAYVVHFWEPMWTGWIWARESSARWHQLTLQLKQTQPCPGASTLHLQCSWRMEEIQLCLSTFVFVYPYCTEAWFNSPEISHGISRCCADLCDPVTSTVMICVCGGLLRRSNTGSFFFPCLARE